MNNLALAYRAARQLDKALPLLEQALEKRKAKLGLNHPDTLITMHNLAAAHLAAKQPDKALLLFDALVAAHRKRLGPADLHLADRLVHMGLDLLKFGQHAEAERLLRQGLAIRAQKISDTWWTFHTHALLGGALLGQKKYADAEPLLVRGYEGMKQREAKIPPRSRPLLTEVLEMLVRLYEATDQNEKADAWRKRLKEAKVAEKKLNP